MYDNIGSKLKGLARVIFAIALIVLLVVGFVSMGSNPIFGVTVIVLGTVGAWCSSLVLYGLGKVIDVAEKMETGTIKAPKTDRKKVASKGETVSAREGLCEDQMKKVICPNCKEELFFSQTEGDAECPYCGASVHLS